MTTHAADGRPCGTGAVRRVVDDLRWVEEWAGATLRPSASHVPGTAGPRGRGLELALARDALAHSRAQRMEEPPEQAAVPVRRELYLALAVPGELLESAPERRRLAESYLALE